MKVYYDRDADLSIIKSKESLPMSFPISVIITAVLDTKTLPSVAILDLEYFITITCRAF